MPYFRSISYIFLIVASLVALTGCFNTRFLSKGEVLFKKNKVDIESEEYLENHAKLEGDIAEISQLQPNKKFLGVFKTRLWFHNVAQGKKETRFRKWVKNRIGEEPVLYDSTLVVRSTTRMQSYLFNRGYFHAEVDHSAKIKRKKAVVTYHVNLNERYYMDTITFPEPTDVITKLINKKKSETVLQRGDPFDVDILKDERERIADHLRNLGYFYFNKEYVYFDLDSNTTEHTVNLKVQVAPPSDSSEHQTYFINNVYVQTDFSIEQFKDTVNPTYDTVQVKDLERLDNYYFVYRDGMLKFRPKILASAIYFNADFLYRKTDHQKTISQLADLGAFRFINIKFRQAPPKHGNKYLDAIIQLTPAKKQTLGFEAEANNSTDYLLGLAAGLSYQNKNLFRGAEFFRLGLTMGLESNLQRGTDFFNTVDLTADASLQFNQFLVPFKMKRLTKNARPKTRISLKYNFLRRINFYSIHSTTLSFGYNWRSNKTMRHYYNPIAVSLVRIGQSTSDFEEILNSSLSLRNSFSEQLIFGSDYTYMWSNQSTRKGNTHFFFRGNVELAGNLVHPIVLAANAKKDNEPPYKLINLRYAQYVRVSGDLRNYFDINDGTQLVTRMYFGIGKPYGNSANLPYVKQFFGGGANDIRAWRVRTLGPGSFNIEDSNLDTDNQFANDQTGDMKLEANMELRFDIFKFLKGALFVDAGNIWTLEADTARPGANFEGDRFYKEIAMGTGFGFRVDFSYFVFRIDLAIPVRDPSELEGDRWVIRGFNVGSKDWRRENLKLNIAIGYPF